MEFKTDNRNYISRYWAGLGFILLVIFGLFLHSLFEKFSLIPLIKKLSLSFLIFFPIFQISGYLSTNKRPKLLKIEDDFFIFYFFRAPSLKLLYSDIESLEYTKDIFKNFEFTLKNGEKKIVYSTLSDNEKAFIAMNERIK
jgi:hypothetical protein